MFEELNAMMNAWYTILDALEELKDADWLMPILCMSADYVAARNGRDTADMLEELLPVIRGVHADFGTMPI